LLLFDTPHQRIIRVNLIEQRVIAIDQITGVATPLPLEALLQHRLIEIQVIDAPRYRAAVAGDAWRTTRAAGSPGVAGGVRRRRRVARAGAP
jgi:hypothetical protein